MRILQRKNKQNQKYEVYVFFKHKPTVSVGCLIYFKFLMSIPKVNGWDSYIHNVAFLEILPLW